MDTPHNSNPVEVYAGNIVEAGMVKSLLESSGIPAYLKDEIMGTLNPWYVTPGGSGSVSVLVAGTDAEAARAVVKEYEQKVAGGEPLPGE